jgi:putative adenylate-forming enzyme
MGNKTDILRSYLRYRFLRFEYREELEQYQRRQLKKYLRWLSEASPYYAALGLGDDLSKYPLMDKKTMMENFDALNTVGLSKEDCFHVALEAEDNRDFTSKLDGITVGLSSGTSGNRGIFLASDAERSLWAGAILAKALPENLFYPQRIAFFLRANSNLYETVRSNHLRFEFYDLLDPLRSHLERLNTQNPTLLIAPPSVLLLLAKFLEDGSLRINPRRIIAVAEVLEPQDRTCLEAVFDQRIHQVYQATEGFLGCTCAEGTMHINEDVLLLEREWVDEANGVFTPIITDFTRRSQPIVRYRLNDLLVRRKEPCLCGSPLLALEAVQGRSDDVLLLSPVSGTEFIPILPDFIRRSIIGSDEHILGYQVTQTAPDRILIFLETPPLAISELEEIHRRIVTSLGKLCLRNAAQIPIVEWSDNLEQTVGGKLRRVHRSF